MIKITLFFDDFIDMCTFVGKVMNPDFRGRVECEQYMCIDDPFKVLVAVPKDEAYKLLLNVWYAMNKVRDFAVVEENGRLKNYVISSTAYKQLMSRYTK